MKNSLPFILILTLAFSSWSCERPKSPDFKVKNQFEIPLTMEKTYPFMGADEALIDTTSEDFINLFSTDGNGLVRLVKEEEVNLGDLNDAIPRVDVTPATLNAEVGELRLTNFNSGAGNVGSAGFDSFTGFSSPPAGQQIPGSSGTVNISFNTDYFESAVIKEDGAVQITLTNNLGFDIDELELVLNSGTSFVGSANIGTEGDPTDSFLWDDPSRTTEIQIPASTQLSDLSVDITVSWDTQDMKEEGSDLVVNDIAGQNLVASQVTAAIESQSFNSSGISTVGDDSFEFQNENHFVELSGGELALDITNNIDIAIESLAITFPDIIDSNGNSFVIDLSNIPRNGTLNDVYDLSGYRIYAQGNTVDYEISATTENTQEGSGSETRTIAETDQIQAQVDINNLQIGRAEGYVVPKEILLNEDQTNDSVENIDVFNDDEAELTQIDGIDEISDRVSNITFENPVLNLLYDSNLGVQTTIYAVIVGTDTDVNTEFLTGTDGSPYQVQSGEIPSQLQVDGHPANENQVIKFDLQKVANPDPTEGTSGSNMFDATNTNASAFFSNLPTNIRFVGVAEVNAAEETGTVVNPVIFDPSFGVEIPFDFSADNATYQDTVDANFEDIPEEDEDRKLSEATMTISYSNALPLDMSLNVVMLNWNGKKITSKSDIAINGASTNQDGFASDAAQGEYEISFSESEMSELHRTRAVVMDITINTPQQQSVSLREDDTVTFKVKVKAGITSTVN
jgi:hypothetical protein